MNDIRINEWSKLKFLDPAEILPKLRELQLKIANSNLNDKIRNLRTNKSKAYREGWEAALFCYGMSNIIGTKVCVVPYESSDYDAIATWLQNEVQHFTPIQIKEVVYSDLSLEENINTEIEKLNRYADSKETTFLFHVNKKGRLDLGAIKIPELNIGSLWLIGSVTPDQSKWFVAGDMLNNPTYIEYEYPND